MPVNTFSKAFKNWLKNQGIDPSEATREQLMFQMDAFEEHKDRRKAMKIQHDVVSLHGIIIG